MIEGNRAAAGSEWGQHRDAWQRYIDVKIINIVRNGDFAMLRMFIILIAMSFSLFFFVSLGSSCEKQTEINSKSTIVDDETTYLSVLSTVSDKINKSLPMAVDRSTRCDSVSPGEKGLIVNYTITNQDMYQIPPELFKESAFDIMKNSTCSDPSFSQVFKLGLGIEFKYWKNNGTFFFSFIIMPSDCSDQSRDAQKAK